MRLVDAVAVYAAGVDVLLSADVAAGSARELVDALAVIETASRRVPTVGYDILARLQHEAAPADHGATSWWKLLTLNLRISKGEANKRLKRAKWLAPRRTLHGEQLPPQWEHTAAAHRDGLIGDEHVEVIRKFLKALPGSVDPITWAQTEMTLAEVAVDLDPIGLTAVAVQLLALLHPDGEEPADAAARKVGLTLGKQQPDGTSYLSGWVSAKLRALIEPVQAKFTERGRHRDTTPAADESQDPLPVDDEPLDQEPAPEPDGRAAEDNPFGPDPDPSPPPAPNPLLNEQWRTKAQFTHDAFEAALDLLLRSQTLGKLNGLPTTVVVTTTLRELLRGAGYAVTAGGSRLPMRDLIAMAADAYHYLAVFDEHTGQALHLGRAQRCATGAQKLALFARERGCTCPGCTVDWYRTQAHHAVADWKRDGQTNVDDLTLACPPGNQMIEDTGWITRKRLDGRFEWVDPVTGRAHLNNLHHPERLLKPKDEEDPP